MNFNIYMTILIAHIYASKAKINSGDFMIGIAYKKFFTNKYLKSSSNVVYHDFDCRNYKLYNNLNINKLNMYDYILIGGGGLILPDSSPNNVSCWQWIISKNNIVKIRKPIYVLSIGYNLFYNQTINMNNRNNNLEKKNRLTIFKENITTLIDKAKIFTLRHNEDVKNLLTIIGDKYKNKIRYEKCATIWYVNKYWTLDNYKNNKYYAIEIKDDREWRRYYKIGKSKYYSELTKIVKYLIQNNKKVLYLSHDGSSKFYKNLIKNNIKIPYLNNSCANENKIRENYNKIHTILCSAGHSQMISDGCNIKIISLVTHPKILNYCNDIGNKEYIDVNNLIKENEIFNRFIAIALPGCSRFAS